MSVGGDALKRPLEQREFGAALTNSIKEKYRVEGVRYQSSWYLYLFCIRGGPSVVDALAFFQNFGA